jgi:hypothetical protein
MGAPRKDAVTERGREVATGEVENDSRDDHSG